MATGQEVDSMEEEIRIKVKTGDTFHNFVVKEDYKKLTSEQKSLLKRINADLWADGVD